MFLDDDEEFTGTEQVCVCVCVKLSRPILAVFVGRRRRRRRRRTTTTTTTVDQTSTRLTWVLCLVLLLCLLQDLKRFLDKQAERGLLLKNGQRYSAAS